PPPRALAEVDHERHALQPVALAQPVLDEVGVVARHERAVRDLDRNPGWRGLELGGVEHAQPPASNGGRLTLGLYVGEEAIQLRGLYPRRRAVAQLQRPSHQPLQAASGL